jgi:aerobic-type carbon monoxide dehydrogenase small subunit (CoxS/CutS family)
MAIPTRRCSGFSATTWASRERSSGAAWRLRSLYRQEKGQAVRACQIPAREAAGRSFTTIEGLSKDGRHPCQRAWIEEDVAQCGYCQPGMIMAASALLREKPSPTDQDIDAVMSELVCRCGTYPRMRKAIHLAARLAKEKR